eukprot:1403041-Prymnesium_polylepis.1
MLREWSTPTRDHHSAPSNGGDDGRDLQPSRCSLSLAVDVVGTYYDAACGLGGHVPPTLDLL